MSEITEILITIVFTGMVILAQNYYLAKSIIEAVNKDENDE